MFLLAQQEGIILAIPNRAYAWDKIAILNVVGNVTGGVGTTSLV